MSESSYATRIIDELRKYNLTPDGQKWLLKSLHPPGPSESASHVDEMYDPHILVNYNSQTVVSAPGDAVWDLLVWSPPGNVACTIWCAAPSGLDFQQVSGNQSLTGTSAGCVCNTGYDEDGTTVFGLAAHIPPSASEATTTFTVSNVLGDARIVAGRRAFASITAELTASQLYNQGTVYSGQYDRFPYSTQSAEATSLPQTLSGSSNVSARVLKVDMPFDENAMVKISPRTQVSAARDGVYMPLRFSSSQMPYGVVSTLNDTFFTSVTGSSGSLIVARYLAFGVSTNNTTLTSAPSQSTQVLIPTTGNANNTTGVIGNRAGDFPHWYYYYFLNQGNGVSNYGGDDVFDGMLHGLQIWRGLDPNASVTLKTISGWQLVPRRDSTLIQFVNPPPISDPKAVELYFAIASKMAVSYPAKFNFLGSLLPLIGSAVRMLAPIVLPPIGKFIMDRVVGASRPPVVKPKKPAPKMQKKRRA